MATKAAFVKVVLRIRPTQTDDKKECLKVIENNIVYLENKSFQFDHVYSPRVTQQDVYKLSIAPLLGFFIEGQTGSGKTYSLGTGIDNQGMIHQFSYSLFNAVEEDDKFQIFVSYLQLYNEDIDDVLSEKTAVEPNIREDDQGNLYWPGIQERVYTAQELIEVLKRGSLTRLKRKTDLNNSHAIFSVILKRQEQIVSKFHFVDLAGSENLKRTSILGEKEILSVNSGLLALGNVISALRTSNQNIPYKDSKLTSLLQDSLGGENVHTLMLACVNPLESNHSETMNTLKYANRIACTSSHSNRALIKTDHSQDEESDEIDYLRTQISRLKMQVSLLSDIQSNRDLEDQVRVLKEEMSSIRSYVHNLNDELIKTKSEKDTLMIASQLDDNEVIESHPVIQGYTEQVEHLKLQVAETQMQLQAANHALSQRKTFSSSLLDIRKSTSTKPVRRSFVKRKYSSKARAIYSPIHKTKKSQLANNVDEFIDLLQKEYEKSTDTLLLDDEENLELSFENFSFSPSVHQQDKPITSPLSPYTSPSPLHEYALFDDEEDKLEALNVPTWSNESKGNQVTKRTSISVDSMWDDTDSSITTSYFNSSTTDTPMVTTASTSCSKSDRKQNKKLLKMLHQAQADVLVKQELVDQLEKTEDLYTQMRSTYEGKLNELKQHLLELQKQRDTAFKRKSKSPSIEQQRRPGSVLQLRENKQAEELRSEYETKLKHLIAENHELRQKNTQLTQTSRTARVKNDSIIRQLQVDMESLAAQKKQLNKSLKVETDHAREASIVYEREIQQLKRREIAALDAKTKLEEAYEAQCQMVKKRSEETAAANAQIRQLTNILRKAAQAGTFLNEANLEKILNGTFAPAKTTVAAKRRSTVGAAANPGVINLRKTTASPSFI
ncbi:hypothetical protein G6F37_005686 [Rhizopus arrhizus]|nr:hypothetical protein G6F38_006834 [Rhizopus arrhizus]KAG1158559.1 hypothetical protein G6F37_005686 [Rhizopus arrhizus]